MEFQISEADQKNLEMKKTVIYFQSQENTYLFNVGFLEELGYVDKMYSSTLHT